MKVEWTSVKNPPEKSGAYWGMTNDKDIRLIIYRNNEWRCFERPNVIMDEWGQYWAEIEEPEAPDVDSLDFKKDQLKNEFTSFYATRPQHELNTLGNRILMRKAWDEAVDRCFLEIEELGCEWKQEGN